VLVGPSGCGKSTLLRMIAGLEEISEGEIAIGGRVVNRVPPKQRDIAMVFQNYALYPHMTVRDNMSFALMLAKQSKVEIETRVKKAADILGLSGLLDRYPRQLSGGQRQRVAMGRAIVRDPQVFLFDEPLSNLDAKLRVQMRHEIRALQRRLGITTVYVTHDQEEAMAVSDRIVVMDRGSVVQEGAAEDLYYRPTSQFVAEFIGRVNLIAGTLVRAPDGRLGVAALGTVIAAAHVPHDLAPGDTVQLMVRPEALAIARDGEATALRATVVSCTFLGEKVEYLLRCAGETLHSVRYNAGPAELVPEGVEVGLRMAEDAVNVLPGERP